MIKKNNLAILSGGDEHAPLPRGFITLLDFQKIKCYVDLLYPREINGFGFVERVNNDFMISNPFLVEQFTKDDSHNVAVDPKAFNRFIYEQIRDGNNSAVGFQWHSHADFPAFFSTEDIDTIKGYMRDYMISLVINKFGDYVCRLDLFRPVHLSLNLPLFVVAPPLSQEWAEKCLDEVQRKVQVVSSVFGWKKNKEIKAENTGDLDNIVLEAEEIKEEVEDGLFKTT